MLTFFYAPPEKHIHPQTQNYPAFPVTQGRSTHQLQNALRKALCKYAQGQISFYISGTTLRLLVLFLTRTTRTGLRSLSAVPPMNGGTCHFSQRILGRRLGSYLRHIVSRTALQPVDRSLWGGVCAYSSSSLPLTFSYDRGKSRESQEPLRKVSATEVKSLFPL